MATNMPPPAPSDTMARFNRVAEEIERKFNQLIERLIQRKDALLQKVVQLREEFLNKEKTRTEALEELLRAQRHMAELSLKANVNLPLHQQAEQLYQQGQKELETPTKLPAITFQCPSLATLQSQICEFGDVVTWKCPDYTSKKKPVVSAVKLGTGNNELKEPTGLALDEISQKVYIADPGNRCVKVFSFQGESLTQFGQDVLIGPWGIAVTEEFIFVTDFIQDSLFQFNKDTLQLINRAGTHGGAEGELRVPRGLCVDRNGDVFIAECWNDRVSVFSSNLSFKSCIGTGILVLPVDVRLSPDTLVVLDRSPSCVRIFSRTGDLLTSCVSQGDKQNCLVQGPFSFCLDPDMNILISDCGHDTIKIFTHSGELIHTLGKKGKSRGELITPNGIAVSYSGTIFVVSTNPNFTFQCY